MVWYRPPIFIIAINDTSQSQRPAQRNKREQKTRRVRWKVATSAERIEAAIARTCGRQIVKPSALGKSIYSHLYKVFSAADALSPSRWSSNVCYFVKADKCFSGAGVGLSTDPHPWKYPATTMFVFSVNACF